MLFIPPSIPHMVPEAEAQSSDVDLVPLVEYVNPYPSGASTISPGSSGFSIHMIMTNYGTGSVSDWSTELIVVDPTGDVFAQNGHTGNMNFDAGNENFTRLTFSFSKLAQISSAGSVPEDKQPPRIFLPPWGPAS